MDFPIKPRNKLLRSLSPKVLDQLRPYLQLVPLKHKRILHHARLPMEQVYFVETGLVSVIAATDQEGNGVEGWIIGSEGVVGTPVALGVFTSPHRQTVQAEGSAWTMVSADLSQATDQIPELRRILLLYVNSQLVQTAQVGACNASHSTPQRLARWLLMAHDRLETSSMALTHDAVSKMLGVRRSSVTEALHELEQSGTVAGGRGQIIILDRPKLESQACHCYGILKAELRRDLKAETMQRDCRVPVLSTMTVSGSSG